MTLKFFILSLVYVFFFQAFAQTPITITGTCSDSEVLGTYQYAGDFNGKASYTKGYNVNIACNDINTEIPCDIPKRYTVRWDGSKWEWIIDLNYIDCEWFDPAGICIPEFTSPTSPSIILLATSSDDTTLPTCNGWVAEPSGCVPNITGCEILSTIQNTFSNDLVLYPNPTNGNVTINLGKTNGSLSISLINFIDQVIWTKEFHNSSLLQFKIDQPSGIYFVEITGGKGEKAHLKVLKE